MRAMAFARTAEMGGFPPPATGKTANMAETNTLSRSLHDVGLAAWFGGTLFGAVGLNESAARRVGNEDAVRA
ncbi:MAG: hypothetical protein JWN99_2387, partial [Ilumatobacteraceae bacterium]|nr:hypothetical protein [Ilumatobacteraceae bacterium]